MKQMQNNILKKEAVSSTFRGRWSKTGGGLLALLLIFLLTLQTAAQTMRWERIKPISEQAELLTPDTADFLLVEDATDGLRKSLKIINLPLSQAAQDSIEALWNDISINQQAIIDSSASLQGQIDLLESSSHPLLTKTGTGTYVSVNEANQVLTVDQIDLTADVTGLLPDGNIASASAWNAKQAAITAGNQLSFSGNTLNVLDGSGSGLDADLIDGQEGIYYDNKAFGFGVTIPAYISDANSEIYSSLRKYTSSAVNTPLGNYGVLLTLPFSLTYNFQIGGSINTEDLYLRNYRNGVHRPWRKIWHSGNLNLWDGSEDLDVNSIETTLDGNSTQWNDAYNHRLIDNDIDNTDELQDTTNIPFLLEFVQNNSIDSYTETDQVYAADSNYLKSHVRDETIHFTQGEISIPANQITDFDTEVANNSAVVANSGKDTTGIYHANRQLLDDIDVSDTTRWGTNYNTDNQQLSIDSTGRVFTINLEDGGSIQFEDQNTTYDLSPFATISQLGDSTALLRSEIPTLLNDLDSAGFNISESQIYDLVHFTNTDETDQVFADDSANIVHFDELDYFTNADELDPIALDSITAHRLDINQNVSDIATLESSSHPLLTKTGTGTYVSLNEANQVLTVDQIDLTTDVTGLLPDGNIASASDWNAKQDAITADNQLSFSGNTLNVLDGSGSGLDADLFDGKQSDFFVHGTNANATTAEDSDLNSITKSGFYASSIGTLNTPTNDAYMTLHSNWDGQNTALELTGHVYSDEWYLRRELSGTWYDWRKIWHDGNLSNLSDLVNDLALSDFSNDVGYITQYTETDPTVKNSTITLQRNGSSIGIFTLNQDNNETFNFIDENTQLSDAEIGAFGYIKDGNTNWDNTYGFTTLQLGETSTTAYQGDRGKIAYDHISSTGSSHSYINQSLTTADEPTFAGLQIGGTLGTNKITGGTGDGANYTTYNFAISGWRGMAMDNPVAAGAFPSQTTAVYDFRNGTWDTKGGYKINGVLKSTNWNDAYTHSQTTTGNPHDIDKGDIGLGNVENAAASTLYVPLSTYTASDVLTKIKTVDGSGSGLDADLLDGRNVSVFWDIVSPTKYQQLTDLNDALGGTWELNSTATNRPPGIDGFSSVVVMNQYGTNVNDLIQWNYPFRGNGEYWFRNKDGSGNWTTWREVYHSGNLNLWNGSEDLDVNSIETTLDGNSTQWNDAYSNKITSASVTGTTTKSITLTQEDSGTISAELFWTGTQAEYDALGSYDSNKIYFIED